jgi:hypothetical protein
LGPFRSVLREEFGKWESALYEVVIATCYAALTAGENWWTRSQSIRTLAQIPIEVPLLDPVQTRKYQEIASEVLLLRKLGLPVYKIAHAVGVADKTVLRALKWADESGDQPATVL